MLLFGVSSLNRIDSENGVKQCKQCFCGLLCLTDAAVVFVALYCTQVCHQNHCVPADVKCGSTFEICLDLFVANVFSI